MTDMEIAPDTIAAIATAPGESAIAIVRMSGPEALAIGRAILSGTRGRTLAPFVARRAHLCELMDQDRIPVDQLVATWYPGPHSYTGEDLLELSLHGGALPCRVALEQCLRHGARPAGPGEFTLRAFLAGRLDLSQAEAVIDTVQAQTRAGLRLAHRQLSGAIHGRVQPLRAVAIGALAQVEAAVDFPDDVEEPNRAALSKHLQTAASLSRELSDESKVGRIYRDGVRLVILGRPNVGKSSLLNALLREERAIVTPIPGTTRDLIEESYTIGGVPVRAVDTAGLRQTEDPVELIGVQRARTSIRTADLCVLVLDSSEALQEDDWDAVSQTFGAPTVMVVNKSDLPARWNPLCDGAGIGLGEKRFSLSNWPAPPIIVTAAVGRGQGLDEVESAILRAIFGGKVISAESVNVTSIRHGVALEKAAGSFANAAETAASSAPLDLISVDLRGALQSLCEITGESAPEDLLHEIFSRFCIGK